MFDLVFQLCIFAVIVEVLFSAFWVADYFRRGFVIYKSHVDLGFAPDAHHLSDTLTHGLKGKGLRNSLVFKPISQQEIGFREKLFELHFASYVQLMHGHIRFVPAKQALVLTGRLNWFIPFVVLFLLASLLLFAPGKTFVLATGLSFILFFLWVFSTQSRRYRQVEELLLKINTKTA